jgi:hypothetical protein
MQLCVSLVGRIDPADIERFFRHVFETRSRRIDRDRCDRLAAKDNDFICVSA